MIMQQEGGPSAAAYWAAFGSAQTPEQFLSSWLSILCTQIGGVTGGLLLVVSDQQHTFVPAAAWPDMGCDLAYLGPQAKASLGDRKGTIARYQGRPGRPDVAGAYLACPVLVSGEVKGTVVLDVDDRADAQLQHALRQAHWASAWLMDHFRQKSHQDVQQRLTIMSAVNALTAMALQEPSLRSSAMAVVNELAHRHQCDRVSLGLAEEGMISLQAVSNSATFDDRTVVMQCIVDAMEEVLDASETLMFPAAANDGLIAAEQAELAQEAGASGVLSVPLMHEGLPLGVLTLERHRGDVFDPGVVATLKVVGVMLGPIMALQRERERTLLQRSRDVARQGMQALFGPRHPGVKLLAATALILTLTLSVIQGDYRVSARTLVEGEVQRATAAPFEGFIAQALVKAGDVVHKGQLMARLDDRDLKVELTRWQAEREQYLRKQRQALANYDRASLHILNAQAEQALSQVQLIEDKLSRTHLLAPFDGVVVAGDLRQLVGTPVELGKVLFETAPLDAYRVVLQIDERDIGNLQTGQPGEVVLSGMPGERLRFTVKQITPVAVAEDGRNFFRVEARMEGRMDRLRPGMEGVGKVEVGRRRLIWIWTHTLLDWLQLSLWTWTP